MSVILWIPEPFCLEGARAVSGYGVQCMIVGVKAGQGEVCLVAWVVLSTVSPPTIQPHNQKGSPVKHIWYLPSVQTAVHPKVQHAVQNRVTWDDGSGVLQSSVFGTASVQSAIQPIEQPSVQHRVSHSG